MLIIEKILVKVFTNIDESWQGVADCKPEKVRSESIPAMAGIAELSETVVVSAFHIQLDGAGGDLHVVMPYSMLEPIRDILEGFGSQDKLAPDETWVSNLTDNVMHANVDINCTMVEKMVTLRDIIDLQAGDIIPIEIEQNMVMTANKVPVFNVTLGKVKENLALQIVNRY